MTHNSKVMASSSTANSPSLNNDSNELPKGEVIFGPLALGGLAAQLAVMELNTEIRNDNNKLKAVETMSSVAAGNKSALSAYNSKLNEADKDTQSANDAVNQAVASGLGAVTNVHLLRKQTAAVKISANADKLASDAANVVPKTQTVVGDDPSVTDTMRQQKAAKKAATDKVLQKYKKMVMKVKNGSNGLPLKTLEQMAKGDSQGNKFLDFNLSESESATGVYPEKVTMRDVISSLSSTERDDFIAGLGRTQRNAMKEVESKRAEYQTHATIANSAVQAGSSAASSAFKSKSATDTADSALEAMEQTLQTQAAQLQQELSRSVSDVAHQASQKLQSAIRTIVDMGQPIRG